eukprot:TRINITY_DN50241_c0_g1_i1.p1 TRINITY_DN50241_c0_g1~~TRINITY_DN50241_c0_g1_i1.p1  ORF type:complete len:268 (-),score=60.33 TRINITY_DN50241_c0_g1_i1:306-1109(-)
MISLGFIGGGQMAEALIGGLIASGVTEKEKVVVSEPFEARRTYMQQKFGVQVTTNNQDVVSASEVVVLAVKPQVAEEALSGLQLSQPGPLFVSILAGTTLAKLSSVLGSTRVARVMPNTPALLGVGAAGFVLGGGCESSDEATVTRVMSAVGIAFKVAKEELLDAVTGLSGSGPAYAYMLIEAMSDGGVKNGLPRDVARALAAQTVLGAAKMVVETGKHPAQLRNEVESPGGTTIAGSCALEDNGFRGAVIAAVNAAAQRSAELGKM